MIKSIGEQKELDSILNEFRSARNKFEGFRSMHEAYAILLEEVDELWDAIKGNLPYDMIKNEARQVGAMALGILLEFSNERT
jgi:hypothetical protein